MRNQSDELNNGVFGRGEKVDWEAAISAPAAELLGEEAQLIDPVVERRGLRKIDMFLMPAIVFGKLSCLCGIKILMLPTVPGYGVVYYDKTSLSSFRVKDAGANTTS